MDTIGKRIRFARKANNLTLIDINKITGLSTGNLSELENDKFLPSANALIQFKKIFNISIDWILTGEEPDPNLSLQSIKETKEEYFSSQYTEDEKQLIESYRKLDDKSKQNLWGYLNVVISSYNK
ncbi:helix-turn-helix domain-containing protein [Alkaliphilus sp. MSJ-5]|uniref:Helix-turn-helix domain-containing protein n=1 Tax=Alkaliphilus flagellatus TaxID=2841507 RepID=A0ABS6G3X7_9FIRM|nr:helix-turn-helix transcriptional regulator [Alkaliphilus flagellatus]MBU5676333.1 helix-turn-helix domain-containing protein [Alkaliphilus flagellatus]